MTDEFHYCRKVSLLEGSKEEDSLLKKLVCGWVCVSESMPEYF